MAVSMSPKQKVYQDILNVIREFIKENGLQAGDKLPSERELAGKLQASRSSVREALRSMELLGLIEVKHGEGTFISVYRPLHSVELLASFILLESNTKQELLIVKHLLEKEGAKLAFVSMNESGTNRSALQSIAASDQNKPAKRHHTFFEYIFSKSNNLLLLKIWGLIHDFSQTVHLSYYEESFYVALLEIYKNGDYHMIEELFSQVTYSSELK